MLTPLNNKVAVITGATKGIGRGLACKFSEHGARLLLINRNKEDGEALVQQLRAQGHEAYFFSADISSEIEMNEAVNYADKMLGQVDIVCANAGIYPCSKIESITLSEWNRVLDVNLKGTFLTVKSFLPFLKKTESGRIILTSSITGPITGFSGWSHYGATKAGQLGFMRTLAIELAQHGITVNAILPGNIMTEGVLEMGDQYIAKMAKAIPMKKLGHVNDIAYTALFLASKESGYITGQSIVVDGGQILPESIDSL